jgi:hypothetical protein
MKPHYLAITVALLFFFTAHYMAAETPDHAIALREALAASGQPFSFFFL